MARRKIAAGDGVHAAHVRQQVPPPAPSGPTVQGYQSAPRPQLGKRRLSWQSGSTVGSKTTLAPLLGAMAIVGYPMRPSSSGAIIKRGASRVARVPALSAHPEQPVSPTATARLSPPYPISLQISSAFMMGPVISVSDSSAETSPNDLFIRLARITQERDDLTEQLTTAHQELASLKRAFVSYAALCMTMYEGLRAVEALAVSKSYAD